MAAEIIDESAEDGNQENVEPAQPETPKQEPQPAVEDVPEKFRGKSLSDIVKSYEELEKNFGKQASEVGELRKTHDEFIRSTLTSAGNGRASIKEESTDDDAEFFVNPKAAIAKAVEQHPLVKQLRDTADTQRKDESLRQLGQRHGDWKEVVADPAFQAFVNSSPIHQRLLADAHETYDVTAADYVISQYKASKQQPAQQQVSAPASDPVKDAARAAAVKAGTVPAGTSAPTDNSGGKKIYRRSDVVRMMQYEPEKYESMAEEILLAYAEKRVR